MNYKFMRHFSVYGALPLMAAVALTGCVDNGYDLSDIDTTTEIKVKDLVIPINLDVVTLGDIIEIKDDSELTEIEVSAEDFFAFNAQINGQSFYAVDKSGTFESKKIEIPGFSAAAPHVNPLTLNISMPSLPSMAPASPAAKIPGINEALEVEYPAAGETPVSTNLNYTARNIDSSIISIQDITLEPFEAEVKFNIGSLQNLGTFILKNVEVALPKGLVYTSLANETSYVDAEGVLHIQTVTFHNGVGYARINVNGISNLPANGYVIDGQRNLVIDQELSVKHATLVVQANSAADLANIGSAVHVEVSFSFDELVAKTVSGRIRYDVEDINIDPVSLNDLPDFLAQDGTNLVLTNPQIYLNLNNPLYEYKLGYQSGLSITQVRNEAEDQRLTLDGNGVFTVLGTQTQSYFVLSPSMPEFIPKGFCFTDPTAQTFLPPTHVPFTSLSNVIAGEGIPQSLRINLIDPQVYEQDVNDFKLGSELPAVVGSWRIIAPLALKAGSNSEIIYTDRKTGWNDADVDAITIEHLSLTMIADSKLPLNAILTGSPIDINGNTIPGVEIDPVPIEGMKDNQEITLVVKGTVTHLDGFEFKATVNSASDEALSPSQTITLKNIRAKVTGHYTKEL